VHLAQPLEAAAAAAAAAAASSRLHVALCDGQSACWQALLQYLQEQQVTRNSRSALDSDIVVFRHSASCATTGALESTRQ
jgi:hypothetical protein